MKLTRAEIDRAKPKAKPYRMTDGGGLVLEVLPTGSKRWRYRWLRDGRDAVLTLGAHPETTLVEARAKAAALRKERDGGVDPAVARDRERERRRTIAGETVAEVARALLKREEGRWSASHHGRFRNRMERDVLPVIGRMRARDVAPVDVSRAIAGIEARGARNTAVRVVGMIGLVMQYAVARGLADQDPTLHMRRGLDHAPPVRHMAAVTDRKELGRLLADIDDWPGETAAKGVLQLCAYLFQRPGEIRAMRRADVDPDAALWTYRVTKVGVEHAVPLAPQVINVLRGFDGPGEHVFASWGKSGFVSDRLHVKLLENIGWHGRHTGHGFRAVARTLLAEDLGYPPHLIERQMSHTVPDAHGRAYNRTLFLSERREMMERYADHLDSLREAAR